MKTLLCLIMILSSLSIPQLPSRTALAMKTGILLRMHVVAQDDTDGMQQLKLIVRDAVREAYASAPGESPSMLARTRQLLPQLTQAAQRAAKAEGFTGQVSVSIEHAVFDERTLDGLTIPAGTYPALMIRLGDAQGRNWWGLIDPELALACAASPAQETIWDWSLSGLWQALFGLSPAQEVAHE